MDQQIVKAHTGRGRNPEPRISTEQLPFFLDNYRAMLNTLNATYYELRTSGTVSEDIEQKRKQWKGREGLPHYGTLCSLGKLTYQSTENLPTYSTVKKIVNFYNQNLFPSTTIDNFLSEHLRMEQKDFYEPSIFRYEPCFLTSYITLNLAYKGDDDAVEFGVLRIFLDEPTHQHHKKEWKNEEVKNYDHHRKALASPMALRAVYFARMPEEEGTQHIQSVKKLLDDYIDNKKRDHDKESRLHLIIFEGRCEISRETLTITLTQNGREDNQLFLTFDIESFIGSRRNAQRAFRGGAGFMLSTDPLSFQSILTAHYETFATKAATLLESAKKGYSSRKKASFFTPVIKDERLSPITPDKQWNKTLTCIASEQPDSKK